MVVLPIPLLTQHFSLAASVGHSKSTLIIIIVVVIVIVALVIGGVFFCLNRKSPLEATSKKRLDDASASAVKQSNIDGPPSMEKSNTLGNKSKSMSKAALTSHVASKSVVSVPVSYQLTTNTVPLFRQTVDKGQIVH